MTTHANPTPRSPADVLKSGSGYRLIESEMLSNGFSATVRITVLHQGSETLWQVEYPLHGAMFGATWWAARRVEVKRVEYRRVESMILAVAGMLRGEIPRSLRWGHETPASAAYLWGCV